MSLPRNVLIFVAVFATSYALFSGISRLWPGPEASQAATTNPFNMTTPPTPQPPLQLNTTILLNGNPWDNPEQLALPSNSKFEIGLRSNQNGNVEVFAINPQGKTSRIWGTRLQAGQDQSTPVLRLQGQRGNETLRIVFKPDAAGATLVKEIKILHV